MNKRDKQIWQFFLDCIKDIRPCNFIGLANCVGTLIKQYDTTGTHEDMIMILGVHNKERERCYEDEQSS